MVPLSLPRPPLDAYALSVAAVVATRATCPRASVGCVILGGDGSILSTGYNGAPRGRAHCTEAGCIIIDHHCRRAMHAEANAVRRLPAGSAPWLAAVTHQPCCQCVQLLAGAGVREIIYAIERDPYPDAFPLAWGVRLKHAPNPTF